MHDKLRHDHSFLANMDHLEFQNCLASPSPSPEKKKFFVQSGLVRFLQFLKFETTLIETTLSKRLSEINASLLLCCQ